MLLVLFMLATIIMSSIWGWLLMKTVKLTIAMSYSQYQPWWQKTQFNFLVKKWRSRNFFLLDIEEDFSVRHSPKQCLLPSFKVQLQTSNKLVWSELSKSRDLLWERTCLDNWKTISCLGGSPAESQTCQIWWQERTTSTQWGHWSGAPCFPDAKDRRPIPSILVWREAGAGSSQWTAGE